MTQRENVLATIAHKEPERVPIGEWGIDHDHVSHIIGRHTYWRNRRDTTLALWDGRRDEVVQSMKADYAELVETLDYDIVTVETVPPRGYRVEDPPRQTGDGIWEDKRGRVYKYAASNDSISCVTPSEARESVTDEDVAQAMRAVEAMDDSEFELVDFCCERFGGQRAILCRSVDVYARLMNPFGGGFEHQLMLTLLAPEEIEKFRPVCAAYNQKLVDHCKARGVDIMMQGQDFGMNTGCMIRPDSFREVFLPVMEDANRRIAQAGMVPFFHCCGRIWDILDDFVSAGYKGYQSIQESAGMDNARMKAEYGQALTLWTGVQCETLVEGSLGEVQDEVMRNLDLLMPGGGFIFGSTNSVQYGARTENYLRALDLVRKHGIYR